MEFREGDKEHVVEVEVLFDGVREMREAFTLHLKPDENMVAETQVCQHLRNSQGHVEVPLWAFSPRQQHCCAAVAVRGAMEHLRLNNRLTVKRQRREREMSGR